MKKVLTIFLGFVACMAFAGETPSRLPNPSLLQPVIVNSIVISNTASSILPVEILTKTVKAQTPIVITSKEVVSAQALNFGSIQIANPDRWLIVKDLIEDTHCYIGNWLGSAIANLQLKISKEGYSDSVMADYFKIKSQLNSK